MNSTLSPVSGFTGKLGDWFVPKCFKPAPKPSSITERVSSAFCRSTFVVIDAVDRIRQLTDGLDKSLKLAVSACVGMLLVPGVQAKFWEELSKHLKHVDGVFSAFSVFGRYNEFIKRDRSGKPAFLGVGPLKNTATAFLAVAKTCEFGRFMQTIGLLSTKALANWDAKVLGGLCAKIGQNSVLGRAAFQAGLGGCKNFFLTISCSYNILHNTIILINWKDKRVGLQKAGLSVGADVGKIYLATAVFAVSVTWVTIAALTAILSLAKILVDSYEKDPLKYPNWMMIKA